MQTATFGLRLRRHARRAAVGVWVRVQELRERLNDRGEVSQTVITIAVLSAGALIVAGILVGKYVAKAKSIQLGG